MLRKSVFLNLSLLFVLGFFVSSCSKDSDVATTENFVFDDGRGLGCLEFVYPISLTLPDGTILEVNSDAEMKKALKGASGPHANHAKPEFVYPFDVINMDGDQVTVEDLESFKTLLEDCDKVKDNDHPDGPIGKAHLGRLVGLLFGNDCFTLTDGLSVSVGDKVITATSAEELKTLLDEYIQSVDVLVPRPELVFPINVTLADGSEVSIENQDELKSLLDDCGFSKGDGPKGHNGHPHKFIRLLDNDCISVVFPVSFVFPDDSTVEVNSADELQAAIEAFVAANPDVHVKPMLVFPVDLILADGSEVTVNSKEELEVIIKNCHD